MKDLVDILADSLDSEPNQKADVMRLVETLYFENIRGSFFWRTIGRRFYPITKSEIFKIAQDVVNIERGIKLNSTIFDIEFKSKTIKDKFTSDGVLKGIKSTKILVITDSDNPISKLNKHLLKDYKYYVTAVMIAELIQDEKSKMAYRQTIAWGIPIIVALIVSKNLNIGEIISKIFNWF